MAIREFFMGKKTAKSAGKRNVDNILNEAEKGKPKVTPKGPAKPAKPKSKPGR